MAGHSKWANIKHRKAVVDARRGKRFTKISKEIIVAARLGGGDPDANTRLRMAIQNARAVSMSNDTIKRAIQRGTGEIDGAVIEELTFEGYGPGGVAVVLLCATDNRNRTVADVRAAFSKYDGNLGETNSVTWNFEHIGEIELCERLNADAQIELALSVGGTDVVETDNGLIIQCPTDDLGQCVHRLAEQGHTAEESRFVWVPNTTVKVTDSAIGKKLVKLLDVLEDHDDIQQVFNNAELDDALVDELT